MPEVTDYQVYAGTAAPINFNGLVRQYYLRRAATWAISRSTSWTSTIATGPATRSHRAVRDALAPIGRSNNAASVKVVEVPPGPPVISPIVAEIYGPDYDEQKRLGRNLEQVFTEHAGHRRHRQQVEADAKRYVIEVDRQRAALLGISQPGQQRDPAMALSGEDVTYIHQARER